jgi:23S rRNA (adenine2503-C2)-methyltransferase|tara:strand:+ start:2276 stop:3391 length:1116 start_codon:yes stop_codon:yes gene_type:complete
VTDVAEPGIERTNFLGLTKQKLEQLLDGLGEKPYRAEQILKWIHHRYVDDFGLMTDISKSLRDSLAAIGTIEDPPIISSKTATDGTRKWLLQAASGSCFETVFIPEENRGTLCVSSQVGCALNCSFCATGQQGFDADLSAAEIIGQVRIAKKVLEGAGRGNERVITNIVLMGMGEPLLNYDSVLDSVSLMMHDLAYGISKRRVTISTAGIVPAIYRMAGQTDVALAISLHAPNDEIRNALVPINRKYPIAQLLQACRHYLGTLGDKRSVTIEYTLIKGVNDQPHHGEELVKLLRGFPCKINLIPLNPLPGSSLQRPNNISVKAFQHRLVNAGLSATVRSTRGDEIQAACGQLAGRLLNASGPKDEQVRRAL